MNGAFAGLYFGTSLCFAHVVCYNGRAYSHTWLFIFMFYDTRSRSPKSFAQIAPDIHRRRC
jgi:hypothetical protein